MAVDDTASINPGATVINPLPNAQSFSLGVGAGLSTEAVATTDIEFFLAFKELTDDWRASQMAYPDACFFNDGLLLESDLKLDALFDSALEPVDAGTLKAGVHPGFAGDTPPPIPRVSSAPQAAPAAKAKTQASAAAAIAKLPNQNFNEALATVNAAPSVYGLDKAIPQFIVPATGDNTETISSNLTDKQRAALADAINSKALKEEIGRIDVQSQELLEHVIKPESDILIASFPACATDINQSRSKSVLQSAFISADRVGLERANPLKDNNQVLGEMRNLNGQLVKTANLLRANFQKCLHEKAKKPAPDLYDPVDLISQTIDFYITSSGSITPTWKLVRVAAPLAPTFASATRKDTNILIIAFGRPDTSKNAAPTSAPVTNQILTSTLRSAFATH